MKQKWKFRMIAEPPSTTILPNTLWILLFYHHDLTYIMQTFMYVSNKQSHYQLRFINYFFALSTSRSKQVSKLRTKIFVITIAKQLIILLNFQRILH